MRRLRSALTLVPVIAILAACQTVEPPPAPPTSVFEAPVKVPAGSNAHGLVIADLNGDDLLDLAVVSSGNDSVVLLMGARNGRYLAAPALNTGPAPKHLTVADVNADGRPDIIVVNQDGHLTPDDDVNVFVQRSTGGFATSPTYSMEACERPHSVAAGHLDADDYVDIVVACWGQDEIALIPGAESGFGPTQFVASGGGDPHAVVVADFDGDGLDDVAVALFGSSAVSVLISDGAHGFGAPALYYGGSSHHGLAVYDIDDDGHPDIVSANRNSHDVSVLLNDGSGVFDVAIYSVGEGRFPVGVAVGDIDGDGYADIVTANSYQNHPNPPGELQPTDISVLFGGPGGGYFTPEHFDVDLTPFAVAIADLDGDGLLDVATANWHSDDVALLYNTGVEPGAGATRTTR